MGHSKFKSSNEVKVFWGNSQLKEQLASQKQATGCHTSGRCMVPPATSVHSGREVATGVVVVSKFNVSVATCQTQTVKEATESILSTVTSLGEKADVNHFWGSYTPYTWVRTTVRSQPRAKTLWRVLEEWFVCALDLSNTSAPVACAGISIRQACILESFTYRDCWAAWLFSKAVD